MAISRGARDPNAAFAAAKILVSKDASLSLSKIMLLPPPRRDLLTEKPTDAIISVFYDAALQSKGWLDPDSGATDTLFREATESITSGRARTSEAVNKVSREVEALIK